MNDILVTVEEAAAEVGVSPRTIYSWKHRGFITPAGKRGRKKVYRLADIFSCERDRSAKDLQHNQA